MSDELEQVVDNACRLIDELRAERERLEAEREHRDAAIRAYLRAHDDWQARRGNAQALHRAERELRELVRE